MTARRLLGWSDLEEGRRRALQGGRGALPPQVWSALAAVGLTAELARRIDAGEPGSASQLWIATAIVGFAVVVFLAPFRMFWRHDSALLARMPLRGGVLYRLALLRSARTALRVALPCVAGACAFGVLLDWELALRHLALVGAAAFAASLLGPAAALTAGALIASDRALALIESVAGGEVGAPKTTWLGLFPGLAATAIGAALLAGAPWAAGLPTTAIGAPAILFGIVLGAPLVALAAAWTRADSDDDAVVEDEPTRPG